MKRTGSKLGGCAKALGIGCLVVGVVAAVVVGLVVGNFDTIRDSDWYRSMSESAEVAKEEFGSMMALRGQLLTHYPAEDIRVNVDARFGNESAGTSLVLDFVNPRFAEPEAVTEELARAIASTAVAIHPRMDRYDQIVIRIERERRAGVRFTRNEGFAFSVAELLDASEETVPAIPTDPQADPESPPAPQTTIP